MDARYRGRRGSFATILGICSGLFVHATASALGLFSDSREVGASFRNCEMGWRGLPFLPCHDDVAACHTGRSVSKHGRAGQIGKTACRLVRRVLGRTVHEHPESQLFYLTFLPPFIAPRDPVIRVSLFLASLRVAMGLVWLSIYSSALHKLNTKLAGGHVRRGIEAVTGGLLKTLGVKLVFARR